MSEDLRLFIRARVKEFLQEIISKGGSGSGNHGHAGRPGHVGGSGVDSSSLEAKKPASIKVTGIYSAKVQSALKYIEQSDIPKYAQIEVTPIKAPKGYVVYGQCKQGSMFIQVNQDTAKNEHPLFLAAIIIHEAAHSIQSPKMPSMGAELRAYSAEAKWAKGLLSKDGITSTEKEVLNKVLYHTKHGYGEGYSAGLYKKYRNPDNPDIIYVWCLNELKLRQEMEEKERRKKLFDQVIQKGGAGSGNYGHRGRPGQIGGSGLGGARYNESTRQWENSDGSALPQHIQACKIPPAWGSVQYNSDPDADLLVTGVDSKGRKQAIYSQRFIQQNADAKFARMMELEAKYDSILKEVSNNIRDHKNIENAACLRLIMTTGIRPGSSKETLAKVKAYGATTLEGRHVIQEGGQVRLKFVGKKGVNIDIPVTDRAVALDLISRKNKAGDNGKLFDTNNSGLLEYSHTQDGGQFKTKDFRTLLANKEAAKEIKTLGWTPKNKKEYMKAVMTVAKNVSTKLGNTATVCLQSYINPAVFGPWRMNWDKS